MYRDIHEHTKTKSDEVMRRSSRYERSGGNDGEATPVPIPNTEVKLSGVDGTRTAGSRESRSPPGKKLVTRKTLSLIFYHYHIIRHNST